MSTPQASIFAPLARCHRHLEYKLAGTADAAALRPLINAVNAMPGVVIGFGYAAWQQLQQEPPAQLKAFTTIGAAPSTQADLWLWIAGDSHSEVLDRSLALHGLVAAQAQLVREIDGQQYHQSRDLSGFEDGSGNPKTDEARQQAACIPAGETGVGGCYVLTQQWQHNLPAFNAVPQQEQEGIIGRTKADSIELRGDAMPASSHVSRTDVNVAGVAQKVWRRSVPWGGVETNGLYFVGFACELSRLEIQLERMFGLTDDGIKDRLTEFSTAISSSWWFAPSQDQLASLTQS